MSKKYPKEIGVWEKSGSDGGSCHVVAYYAPPEGLQPQNARLDGHVTRKLDGKGVEWNFAYATKHMCIESRAYDRASRAFARLVLILDRLGIRLPVELQENVFLDAEIEGEL